MKFFHKIFNWIASPEFSDFESWSQIKFYNTTSENLSKKLEYWSTKLQIMVNVLKFQTPKKERTP